MNDGENHCPDLTKQKETLVTVPENEDFNQLRDTMEFIGTFLDQLLAHKEYVDLGRDYEKFQLTEVAIKKERKSCTRIQTKLQCLHENILKSEFADDCSKELERISEWAMKELLGKTVKGKPFYYLQNKLRQVGLLLPVVSSSWISLQRTLTKMNSQIFAKHLVKVTSFIADVKESGVLARKIEDPLINALFLEIDAIVSSNADDNGCIHVKSRSGGEEYKGIFRNPTDCALALVMMQREIYRRNGFSPNDEKIYVRMGMNEGMIPFFCGKPYYGEGYGEGIVNAARICSIADGGQIIVTDSTAKNLDQPVLESKGVQVIKYGQPVRIKEYEGKVCQLIWRPDQECKPPKGCNATDAEWMIGPRR